MINQLAESENLDFDDIWQKCGTNLRAGKVRLVVAVDYAPQDLVRIVRFSNDHSDIDVRLVEISKYENIPGTNETIYVPNFIVYGGGNQVVHSNKTMNREYEKFEEIVSEYNKIADSKYRNYSKAKGYRKISVKTWPKDVHYEFFLAKNSVGVEIHLEGDNVKFLSDKLKTLESSLKNIFNKADLVEWDSKWSSKRGRLRISYNISYDSSIIANAMKELINRTYDTINSELKNNNLLSS